MILIIKFQDKAKYKIIDIQEFTGKSQIIFTQTIAIKKNITKIHGMLNFKC